MGRRGDGKVRFLSQPFQSVNDIVITKFILTIYQPRARLSMNPGPEALLSNSTTRERRKPAHRESAYLDKMENGSWVSCNFECRSSSSDRLIFFEMTLFWQDNRILDGMLD
jgi:hypothetical protein